MWLILALVLLVLFGGGLIAGLGHFIYLLLVLAIVFGVIHFIQRH